MDPATMAGAMKLFGDVSGGSAPSGIGGYDQLKSGDSSSRGSTITIGTPPSTQQTGLIVAGVVVFTLLGFVVLSRMR